MVLLLIKSKKHYIMPSIIKSVSLTPTEVDFLEDNNLSPTGLLKQRIAEIKILHNSSKIRKMSSTIDFLNKKLQEKHEEIIKLNKLQDWADND